MKRCSRCGEVKLLEDFGRNRRSADGLSWWCRGCVSAYASVWRRANRDRENEYERRHRLKRSIKDRVCCRCGTSYRPRPDRQDAWCRDCDRAFRVDARGRRRARELGNGYEPINRNAIYDRDKGICHICRKKVARSNFTLDHLIPIAEGGPHLATNVAVAHRNCNCRRGVGRTAAQLRLVG